MSINPRSTKRYTFHARHGVWEHTWPDLTIRQGFAQVAMNLYYNAGIPRPVASRWPNTITEFDRWYEHPSGYEYKVSTDAR